MCKHCKKVSGTKAWREANADYVRATGLAWRRANKEQHYASSKAWYEANRDHALAVRKTWRTANPERHAELGKAWRAANPDETHAHSRARQTRKAKLFIEDVLKSVVFKRDNGLCHLCLKKASNDWQLDHVISLNDGGPHCYANTAVACKSCNLSKHDSSWSGDAARWRAALAAYKAFHGVAFKAAA